MIRQLITSLIPRLVTAQCDRFLPVHLVGCNAHRKRFTRSMSSNEYKYDHLGKHYTDCSLVSKEIKNHQKETSFTSENDFAYSVLENNIRYKSRIINREMIWKNGNYARNFPDGAKHFIYQFEEIRCLNTRSAQLEFLSSHQFKNLCEDLVNSLQMLSRGNFLELITLISQLPFRRNTISGYYLFNGFFNSFKERIRSGKCKFRDVFNIVCLYHNLCIAIHEQGVKDISKLTYSVAEHNWSKLLLEDLVCICFVMNIERTVSKELASRLEILLAKNVEHMNIDEVAVVCLGYYKTKTPFRKLNFRDSISMKLASNATQCHSMCVGAIVKQLTLSASMIPGRRTSYRTTSVKLLSALTPVICNLNTETVIHILWYCHKTRYLSMLLMEAVCDHLKVSTKLKNMRLKDLAKFLFILGQFQHRVEDKDFYQEFVDELGNRRHEDAVNTFPSKFLLAMVGLSLVPMYPERFLKQIFSRHFPKNQSSMNLERDAYQLSESVRIENPEYSGPLLPRDFQNGYYERFLNYDSQSSNAVSYVKKILDLLLGRQNYYKAHSILPHFQSIDIEIRMNSCNEPVPVDMWKPLRLDNMEMMESGQSRVALVINPLKHYYMMQYQDGTTEQRLRGITKAKIRQLKTIGYTIIQIEPKHIFSSEKMENHLRETIVNKIKQI